MDKYLTYTEFALKLMTCPSNNHTGQYRFGAVFGFIFLHLAASAVLLYTFFAEAALAGYATYSLRMFAVTAGYHRYFSHRSYKMGRIAQFVMAFLAQSSAQKGVLWWAAQHRRTPSPFR